MNVNLCVGGEAITNSFSTENGISYEASLAFDGNKETVYGSESFVASIRPYVGYKFPSPVSIDEIYLYQATYRWCTDINVIYSDDGKNWETAELFTDLKVENTLMLSKDYGGHLYWCLQAVSNPVGEKPEYPWDVGEIEMYGYSTSGDNNNNTDDNSGNNNTEDNEATEDDNTNNNETEKTNTMSEVIKNSVKNTILNNELIRHCITYENET